MRIFLKILAFLMIFGCGAKGKSKAGFSNKGVTTVLNGRNEIDSLKYSCDSCNEILQDKTLFDTIILIATAEAKEILKNKLSFKPMSVEMEAYRPNSLYYTNGSRIDSLVSIFAKYKCIGKNGYGVEDEVESTSLIHLINGKITDLDGKIRKEPLKILQDDLISRNLSLYDDDGKIIVQPVKLKSGIHLIVTTGESCVEDSRLTIGFADKEEISVTSWNKFNCDNTSYFMLTTSQKQSLKSKPILYLSFSEDDFVYCSVPENERDYFMQVFNLIK